MTWLAIFAAVLLAESEPRIFELQTEFEVWDLTTVDLNGDGRKDLLAFCSAANAYPQEKTLSVFLADEKGRYPAKPSSRLMLDPSVGTAFVSETDGKSPQEVVTANHAGVTVYRLVEGQLQPIKESAFTSLLPTGAAEPLFFKDATVDLDDDGIDEWIIPTAAGYEIRHADGLVARVPGHIASETREFGVMVVQHRLPAIQAFELPGEDTRGIAFLSDQFADFSYGPKWSQHTRYQIPRRLDENWDASVRMDDINHDGFPDLVVTQTQGTINLKVMTHVYIATKPFTYPEKPNAQFETKGTFTTPALIDINEDDQLDLVFLGVHLGLRNIINYFFRKKISVQVEAHIFEDGSFPEDATFDARMTMEAPEGRERVAYTMGDFTGDGHLDAAVGSNATKLSVYEGHPKSFLSSRPWKTFKMPTFGIARSDDLDDNGTDDITIFHPSGDHQKQIEVILF